MTMPTAKSIHIITVGLSILGTFEDIKLSKRRGRVGASMGKAFGSDEEFSNSALNPFPEFIKEAWKLVGSSVDVSDASFDKGTPGKQLQDVLKALEEDAKIVSKTSRRSSSRSPAEDVKWSRARVSAELEGFNAFKFSGKNSDPQRKLFPSEDPDTIVLLVSDTDDHKEKLAAFWNAGILVNGDFGRVTLVEEAFPQGESHPTVGHVYVFKMADLDYEVTNFVESLGDFGGDFFFKFTKGVKDQRHYEFHLSGGFKAALPYFLALGEWMKSEFSDSGKEFVRAWAIHEDSPGREPVQLPLRRLPLHNHTERALVRDLAADKSGPYEAPRYPYLQGYAYENMVPTNDPGNKVTAKITKLGRGYARFLKLNSRNP